MRISKREIANIAVCSPLSVSGLKVKMVQGSRSILNFLDPRRDWQRVPPIQVEKILYPHAP
jgi:hypothetical protein